MKLSTNEAEAVANAVWDCLATKPGGFTRADFTNALRVCQTNAAESTLCLMAVQDVILAAHQRGTLMHSRRDNWLLRFVRAAQKLGLDVTVEFRSSGIDGRPDARITAVSSLRSREPRQVVYST